MRSEGETCCVSTGASSSCAASNSQICSSFSSCEMVDSIAVESSFDILEALEIDD